MIRSRLCLHDVGTGTTREVLGTDRVIEAPNWSPCGRYLLVNGGGALFRVPMDKPDLQKVDTGFATRLNNDHGISPDGRWIAMSNHTIPGQSCIYLMPSDGGDPRQVTRRTPSWWHGWSPDGRRCCYTAMRHGAFQICTIPVGGGPETCVTGGNGHHDGPDYSADGQWIWFNADTDGGMQIWRVRPDGRNRQRMTEGNRVNWFPHPSPDGRWVVYLSYPPGTEGHPRDLEVELRLMPQAGGTSRRLVSLLGGQGTINVPSWSPDGAAFAFVRYEPG